MRNLTTPINLKQLYLDLKTERLPYKRCPTCGDRAYQTHWRPQNGLDPCLREYLCLWGHATYRVNEDLVVISKKEGL